ncbi:MFS transporter [Fructilactobacillus carniphilus]|uniref:MFS transporter n=1 Tax=Fructilactobacillus carniphilus TaxID=2940297 RepID=A0ABY5BW52_9LACO|nr:MFS transporter [Fructilactobacillus carniphilus]USS90724.1 MFS transporter [Fructilactobacillus carniphilus]
MAKRNNGVEKMKRFRFSDLVRGTYSPMMRFSLLSVSLVLASALSVSAAVPQWQRAFPGHSYSAIEIIATMPALAVIIMLLLSNWVAKYMKPKRTVIVGLIISGVFGMIPLFATNYYVVLLSRFCFGIGLGLINGLAVSLIGTFFEGKLKDRLMGYRSGFEMLGNAICSYIAGALLVDHGWHSSFLVYAIAFPVAVLFYYFVPEPKEEPKMEVDKRSPRLNPDVIFWTMLLAAYQVTYVGATVRLSSFIEHANLGTIAQSAMVISIAPFFGLMGGILFGNALTTFRKFMLPLALIATGLSQLVVGMAHGFFTAALGMFLITMLDTMVVTYILNVASDISPKGTLNVTTSILLIGSNIGIFLAPVVLGGINQVFSSDSPRLAFWVSGIALLVMGAIGIYDLLFIRHKLFR